ncbi:GAF domain-containing sensor histidine kinase [Planomonospora sp. ID67723]|uniref:GAF domain-containing sensor histidine kinase n=1 Tax=Planomonospora sp. ID67723 TaxID=2738134 RepID=UPI0018C4297B|nr:GAF domain-containing sensor histidine kinase [Planomonospora sp. ID67723]MBG0832180.1 GAF domain-containing sensor histidine kinase [Planomonospora sp. ID67723]
MVETPVPPDEAERVRELEELGVLEAPLEPDLDAIAMLAAHVCGAPMALVNLLDADRQHFKGRSGVTWTGAERESGYCHRTVCGRDLLEIPDTLADPVFSRNVVAEGEPYVRYYAGVPLISKRGHALGTVCVLDHRPRRLTPEQQQLLRTLAASVTTMLELYRHAAGSGEPVPRPPDLERLRDQFLTSINHELRTPMTSIRNALQLLQEGGLDEATERRFMAVMERNNDRLLRLLDELLLTASLNAGTAAFAPERTDLTGVVRLAVDDVADALRSREHALTVQTPTEAVVRADPGMLRIALRNVLDNAVKFTTPGGTIAVTVTAGPEPTVEVRDTGMGIGADDLGHVLEDFYRGAETEERAIDGTGLGLSVTDKIVRLHGGAVRLESEPGEGTCVRLTLPVPPEAPPVEYGPGGSGEADGAAAGGEGEVEGGADAGRGGADGGDGVDGV